MEFVKKTLLCDKDVMHTDDMITYGLLTQESLREYSNIVNSKKFDFKSRRSGNGSGSEKGSFTRSNGKCHKCGKKGHLERNSKSSRNGSNGELSKISTRKLPKWVTKKPKISDVENMTTATVEGIRTKGSNL